MGQFLNPGKTSYEEAVNSQIFVDKTEMIAFLNTLVRTKQKYVCVSRPRRFGKTMAADMICAYYGHESDSRTMFESLKLSDSYSLYSDLSWDAYLGKFDVIRIVMTEFFDSRNSFDIGLKKLQSLVCRDIKKKYPDVDYSDDNDLLQTIADAYSDNESQIVFVIDEWDAVFRDGITSKADQTRYLDFLRNLLKDKSYISLAYITGIMPIKKNGQRSELSMFTEYSMMFPRQLARFTGFTETEVKDLCNRYGRDYDTIKAWYGGYEVSDVIPSNMNYDNLIGIGTETDKNKYFLYSPLSVVEAISTGVIKDYWNSTETYEALADYIIKDYDGLKEAVTLLVSGARLGIDTSTYQNDMTTFTGKDDVLSLLIHLGYLGYDDENREIYIPNKEILDEFNTCIKAIKGERQDF